MQELTKKKGKIRLKKSVIKRNLKFFLPLLSPINRALLPTQKKNLKKALDIHLKPCHNTATKHQQEDNLNIETAIIIFSIWCLYTLVTAIVPSR